MGNNLQKLSPKVILPIFLLLFAIVVLAQTTTLLQAISVSAEANSSNVSVPISLNNDNFVAGLQFDVNYTTFLTFKGFELTSRASNASVEINSTTPGKLKIAALIEDEISPGDGSIMNLLFDVDEQAISGDYPLNLSQVSVGDINVTFLLTDPIDGIFSIVSDTDEDGISNADDLCLTIPGTEEFQGCPQWILLHTGVPPLEISGSKTNFSGGYFHSNGRIEISGSDNLFTHNVSSNTTITISGSNNNAPAFNELQQDKHFNFIDCNDLVAANWTVESGNLIISDSDQTISGNIVVQGFVEISGGNVTVNGGIAATNKITLSGSDININSDNLAICTNKDLIISGSENSIKGISHVVKSAKMAGSKNNLNSVLTNNMVDKINAIPGSENVLIYNITTWQGFDALLQEMN